MVIVVQAHFRRRGEALPCYGGLLCAKMARGIGMVSTVAGAAVPILQAALPGSDCVSFAQPAKRIARITSIER